VCDLAKHCCLFKSHLISAAGACFETAVVVHSSDRAFITAIVVIILEIYYFHNSARLFLGTGFHVNVLFWKVLLAQGFRSTFYFQCHYLTYTLGFPWLVTGILSTLDLIPRSPQRRSIARDISNKQLDKIVSRLPDAEEAFY
jgi:hypothetical protein